MITEQQKQAIKKICAREPILVAYLFGSRANGHERKGSDTDIAVSVSGALSQEHRFALRLKLMKHISRIMQCDVDVVMLNDIVSPFFKYVIITEGILIYQISEIRRIEIESNIYALYFDFQPFLQSYARHYVTHRHQ